MEVLLVFWDTALGMVVFCDTWFWF